MTDHDQQLQRVGHATSGEAGGTCAVRQNGREAIATLGILTQEFCLFGQVVTGLMAATVQRSGSENLTQ